MSKILRKIRDIVVIIIILFIINNLYFVNISLAIKSVDEIDAKFVEAANKLYKEEKEWRKKLYLKDDKIDGKVADEIINEMMKDVSDETIEEWSNFIYGKTTSTGKIQGMRDTILESATDQDKKVYEKIFKKITERYMASGKNSEIKESTEELMEYDIYEIQDWLTDNSNLIEKLPDEVENKWQEVINNEEDEYQRILTQNLLDGMTLNEAETDADRKVYSGKADSAIYKYPSRDDTGKNNSEQSLEDMVSDANSFINSGELKLDQDALSNFSKTMYNILLAIGVVVAVIVGAIIGIKLMTSSIEEKAEAKKLLVPYIVGCAVVFGGFGIWKIVVTMLQHI